MDFSIEKTSVNIVDEIAEFIGPMEGCARCKPDGLIYPYICPTGHPTQGYGILVKDMNVPPITKEEALNRFKQEIPKYIQKAIALSPGIAQDRPRLIAVTSFIYNLGEGAYAGSSLRKKINNKDFQSAAKEIQKWNHGRVGGQLVVLNGLTKRRIAEANLLLET
jgi:lysozyme